MYWLKPLCMSCVLMLPCWLQAQPLPGDLKLVGQAGLRVFFMNIYEAELLNDTGEWQSMQGPHLLRLTYQRDISRDQLIKETRKRLGDDVPSGLKAGWLKTLQAMWPDVQKGEQLSFLMDRYGIGHFYHRGQYLGSVDDHEFSHAFLNIWLGDDSGYPKLTRRLRGEL
jgi:hypothetical protein